MNIATQTDDTLELADAYLDQATLDARSETANSSVRSANQQPLESAQSQTVEPESKSSLEQICWKLLTQVKAADTLENYLREFVNLWCRTLGADQVFAIVHRRKGKQTNSSAVAASGVDSFDANSPTINELEALCNAYAKSADVVFWNLRTSNQATSCGMLSSFAIANGFQSAIMLPVVKSQAASSTSSHPDTIGHIVVFASSPRLQQSQVERVSGELFPQVANQIHLHKRAEGLWLSRLLTKVHQHFFRSRAKLWGIIGFAILLTLCFPMPHQLSCKSTLQPTLRRYVAAPFEGRLDQSHVLPGDRVTCDQLLATMDDDDLLLQLEGAIAEHSREKERHDGALSEGKISDAQIATLEMEKLDHEIDLLRTQLRQLEIRSPIDGVVVSGDLEKAEGAPVEIGQTLFEIGPIDSFTVEIAVPEKEIRFLKIGLDANVRFNAFPLEKFVGEIQRIQPRAEVRDGGAVFVATVQVENIDGRLKPGMEGTATINTGPSIFAWNLFHRPIENARSYIGF